MDILKFATFKTFPMFDCFSNFPQCVGNDKKGFDGQSFQKNNSFVDPF